MPSVSVSFGDPAFLSVRFRYGEFTVGPFPKFDSFTDEIDISIPRLELTDDLIESPVPERITIPPFDVTQSVPVPSFTETTDISTDDFPDLGIEVATGVGININEDEIFILGREIEVIDPFDPVDADFDFDIDFGTFTFTSIFISSRWDFSEEIQREVEFDLGFLPDLSLPFGVGFDEVGFTEGELFDRRLFFDLPEFRTVLFGGASFTVPPVPTGVTFSSDLNIPNPASFSLDGSVRRERLFEQIIPGTLATFLSDPDTFIVDRLTAATSVPVTFLSEPATWAFEAFTDQLQQRIDVDTAELFVGVINGFLELLLSDETKQKVNDLRREE